MLLCQLNTNRRQRFRCHLDSYSGVQRPSFHALSERVLLQQRHRDAPRATCLYLLRMPVHCWVSLASF